MVHIDSQRAMERRIARNYELNDLAWDERALRVGDAYRILRDFRQRERQFDLVILDPPPGVKPKGKRRKSRGQDYPALLKLAVPLVAPGGILLTFLNQRGVSSEMHHSGVQRVARGAASLLWTVGSGADFPEENEESQLRVFAHGFLDENAVPSDESRPSGVP